MAVGDGVCVFVDHSNIFLNMREVAKAREGRKTSAKVRLEYEHLLQVALRGRKLLRGAIVGSMMSEQQADAMRRTCKLKVERYGTVDGNEQAVDQALQVHLLRAGYDYRAEPRTIVLMTGDGAGYGDGRGFRADIERLYQTNWDIELVSWNRSCNPEFRDWANEFGVYLALDEFYDECTYHDGRKAKALDERRYEFYAKKG